MKTATKKILSCTLAFAMSASLVMGLPGAGLQANAEQSLNPDPSNPQYYQKYSTIEEARKEGNAINERIAEEGIALFKNELVGESKALPLEKNSSISLFGSCSTNLRQAGSGSGSGSSNAGEYQTTKEIFTQAGFKINDKLYSMYESKNSRNEIGMENYTAEITNSYKEYSDAAIIFLSRADGGENYDANLGDGTSNHSQQMNNNEIALLNHVKEAKDGNGEPLFKKIILCINTADPFEVARYQDDERVQAVIWMGFLGSTGLKALPKILNGDVNPSGHTVDAWPANLRQDPAWFNFGTNKQVGASTNIIGNDPTGASFAENNSIYKAATYKEGIYMGYRWYETAATVDGYYSNTVGETNYTDPLHADDAYYNRYNGILYPFGYGLSYTTFEWTVGEPSFAAGEIKAADAGTEVTVPVTVKNTGDVAGKDVVQMYLRAPYGPDAPIEKSDITYINSAKTDLLAPGEEQTVEITFNIRDFASFDWNDINKNDFQGYELEAGQYDLLFRTDSHTDKNADFKISYFVSGDGIQYNEEDINSPLNYNQGFGENAKAVFSQQDEYNTSGIGAIDAEGNRVTQKDMDYVTRADWKLPTPSDTEQMTWTDKATGILFDQVYTSSEGTNGDKETDPWYKTAEDIPGYGKTRDQLEEGDWKQASEEDVAARKNGKTAIQLKDMIGIPLDDPKWVEFMNQLTFDEMTYISNNARYTSPAMPAIGKPATEDKDGPGQLSANAGKSTFWCCETTISATYNTELAYEMGYQMGQECLTLGVTGWYGPGLNTHRLAFNGRNFEYYSSDGRQGGWMAAAVIQGAVDNGIHIFAKHYVCNDMETDRNSGGGVSIFLTEQALREIYLKPFEIATKYGDMNGMMTCHGKVGMLRVESNYMLCNYFLYDECGYDGSSVTDANSTDFTTNIANGSAPQVTGDRLARCRVLPLSWNTTPASSDNALNGRRTEGRYDAVNNKLMVPEVNVDDNSWTYINGDFGGGYTATVTNSGKWDKESPTQWYSVRMNAMYFLYQAANSCQMRGEANGDQVGSIVTVHYNDGVNEDLEIKCGTDETLMEPEAPSFNAAKERFMGWYFDEECTQPVSFPLIVTKSVNLYPLIVPMTMCVQKYDLNYDGAPAAVTEYYEDGAMINLPAFNPVRPGFTFEGWYLEETCINKVDANNSQALVITADRTFYAKWTATGKIIVSFNYNFDGSAGAKTIAIEVGEVIMPPVYPPVREGYVFTGWYTDQSCEYKADFTQAIEYDMSFYAGWEIATDSSGVADTQTGITVTEGVLIGVVVVLGAIVVSGGALIFIKKLRGTKNK